MTRLRTFFIISFVTAAWCFLSAAVQAREGSGNGGEPSGNRPERAAGEKADKTGKTASKGRQEPEKGGSKRRSRHRFRNVKLKTGQHAPDFALTPLVFEKDEKGGMAGTIGTKPVKLSDFKGKAPVCIFSSSYT